MACLSSDGLQAMIVAQNEVMGQRSDADEHFQPGQVYGTKEGVQSVLQALGQRINTSYIERVNRTLRAHVPGLGRREEGLAKGEMSLRRRSILVMGYYNLCLPHTSLRAALVQPMPTKGSGSAKKWRLSGIWGGIPNM